MLIVYKILISQSLIIDKFSSRIGKYDGSWVILETVIVTIITL